MRPPAALGGTDPLLDPLLEQVQRTAGLARTPQLAARLARAVPPAGRAALAARLPLLGWDDPAWQALLAALPVQETYLFRDWPQLQHLAAAGLRGRIAGAAGGGRTLRLWSAGCASGEEAYSLAALALAALLEAGRAQEGAGGIVPAAGWALDVVGSDVSGAALDRGRAGSYRTGGLSAFRAMPEGFERFFPPGPPGTRVVRQDVRAKVRFMPANLLTAPPVREADVVACRNVLLYFTAPARRRALQGLADALAPGGLLLLGPTDPAPALEVFEPLWSDGPVIYRKRG